MDDTGIPPAKVLDFLSSQRDLNISMLNELKRIEAAISGNPAVLTPPQAATNPYSTVTIDLTTAKTLYRITIPKPISFIQFWTDGQFDGIFAFVGTQSAQPVDLSQMSSIPISGTYQDLFITSDVRQGRSRLVVYFVREANPLQLTLGGQGISLAETAARLGSISLFDRRGDILWQDDFSTGLTLWNATCSAGGATPCISSDYPFNTSNGGVSAKLSLLQGNGKIASITRFEVYPTLSQMGMEIAFMVLAGMNKIIFDLKCGVLDGANGVIAQLRYDGSLGKIQYLNSANGYTDLAASVALSTGNQNYHRMKVVFDMKSRNYVRAYIDNYLFNLANISAYQYASVTSPGSSASFYLTNTDAGNPYVVYAANAIQTTNEP